MKKLFFVVLASLSFSLPALGAPRDFAEGTRALENGEFETAIVRFEALADRGARSPSASVNRGLAYLARASSPSKQIGDLGQAAAAFSEATLLAPGDEEARLLLEEVRLRIAKDKSAHGGKPLLEVTPLSTRVLRALSPRFLFAAGVLSSLFLTIGLALFHSARRSLRAAAITLSSIFGFSLVATGVLSGFKEHRERSSRPAVVVATRAPLLNELGRPLKGAEPLSEGAYVEVLAQRSRLFEVATESGSRHVEAGQLRILTIN